MGAQHITANHGAPQHAITQHIKTHCIITHSHTATKLTTKKESDRNTDMDNQSCCLVHLRQNQHRCGQVQVSDKAREAVSTSGQEEFLAEQASLLKGVRGEWAALRSAVRRRVGAARTLLLTDGTCRLHAVPADRLEQVCLRSHVTVL